jgi:hypothetical protein
MATETVDVTGRQVVENQGGRNNVEAIGEIKVNKTTVAPELTIRLSNKAGSCCFNSGRTMPRKSKLRLENAICVHVGYMF